MSDLGKPPTAQDPAIEHAERVWEELNSAWCQIEVGRWASWLRPIYDAADIRQEVALRAMNRVPVEPIGSYKAWVAAFVRRVGLGWLKKCKQCPLPLGEVDPPDPKPVPSGFESARPELPEDCGAATEIALDPTWRADFERWTVGVRGSLLARITLSRHEEPGLEWWVRFYEILAARLDTATTEREAYLSVLLRYYGHPHTTIALVLGIDPPRARQYWCRFRRDVEGKKSDES